MLAKQTELFIKKKIQKNDVQCSTCSENGVFVIYPKSKHNRDARKSVVNEKRKVIQPLHLKVIKA